MDKSNFIYTVLVFLIIIAVFIRFNDYYLKKDFLVKSTVPCNAEEANCFIFECDTEIDTECDLSPYKKIFISAELAPKCIFDHNCENFECTEKNKCVVKYCREDSVEEGEVCSIKNDDV